MAYIVGMYKNQLQEVAQRSCFNLPSYTCIREGPDHAPRFRASVNFNGEVFEGPGYCTTLRQAEHAAAEVALATLSTRAPSRCLAAKVLDELGVYKNLLQESVHRAGLTLPVYSTERSGPGHLPVFVSIVELAGMNFTGESARTKKQAEKNAAMAAWSALKQLSNVGSATNKETDHNSEEQEHVAVARTLSNFKPEAKNMILRHRDQNQVRSRIVSSYRDKNSASSSSNTFFQQRCNSLPPTASTDKTSQSHCPPSQVRRSCYLKMQPPLEEHQKDEDEWLYGVADTKGKSIEKNSTCANSNAVFRPFNSQGPVHSIHYNTESILMRTMHHPNGTAASAPRSGLNNGRFGVAQAVHIRSVIPVCAAPPTRPPSSNTPISAPQEKQDLISSSLLKRTEQEVPEEASSKLSNLHL